MLSAPCLGKLRARVAVSYLPETQFSCHFRPFYNLSSKPISYVWLARRRPHDLLKAPFGRYTKIKIFVSARPDFFEHRPPLRLMTRIRLRSFCVESRISKLRNLILGLAANRLIQAEFRINPSF